MEVISFISRWMLLDTAPPAKQGKLFFLFSGFFNRSRVIIPREEGGLVCREAVREIRAFQVQKHRVYVLLPKRVSKLGSVEIKEMSNKTSIRRHKIKYGQGEQVRLCLGAWGRSISLLASQESCPVSLQLGADQLTACRQTVASAALTHNLPHPKSTERGKNL